MTAAPAAPRPPARPPARAAVLAIGAALVFQLALIAAWAGAMKTPRLHEQEVGVVVSAGAQTSAAAFTPVPADAIVWRRLADPDVALDQVSHGDLAAAVLLGPDGVTAFVASGGGPLTAQALTKVFTARARAAGLPLRVRDLRRPQGGDPRTLGLYVLILGWVAGGIAAAALLGRSRGPAAGTPPGALGLLAGEAAFAVVAGVLGTVLVDPLLTMMTGHPVALGAVGALVMWSVSAFVTALVALFGRAGVVLAVGALIIVGNPVSGAMVPTSMLPSGWRFLAEVVPNTAGVRLVRSIIYFDGHGVGEPLLVLWLYAGIAAVVTLGLALRRSRRAPAAAAAAVAPAPQADRVEVR